MAFSRSFGNALNKGKFCVDFIAVRDLAMRLERRRRALRMGRGFRMDFVWLDVAERLTRNGRYVLVSLSPPIACVTHLREAATLRCVPRAGEGADRLQAWNASGNSFCAARRGRTTCKNRRNFYLAQRVPTAYATHFSPFVKQRLYDAFRGPGRGRIDSRYGMPVGVHSVWPDAAAKHAKTAVTFDGPRE